MSPRALFRCEADVTIGGGHVMRCLAFAEALSWAGWRIAFSTSAQSIATVPALSTSGVIVVPPAANDDDPATRLVVFDHYGLEARDERGFASEHRVIVAFDDLADRPHACAVLVDPAPGRVAADYAPHLPTACRLLLGPRHAMLGARWRASGVESRARIARGGAVRRILVAMGATDPVDATTRVLDALHASGLEAEIDVVLGAAAPFRHKVEHRLRARQTLHVQPENIVELVAAADLAIGAPGSSSFERAALGIPSLLIPTAPNQRKMAEGLAAAGAAILVPPARLDEPHALGIDIARLAHDVEQRLAMSRACVALGDGRGALRLLAAIAGTSSGRDGASLHLRLAETSDEDWLLDLQRAPATRRYARTPALPSATEHAVWMAQSLVDPERLLCIVERNGEPAGTVRLDRLDSQAPRFEVSIAVHPAMHRLGIGGAALHLLRRLAPGATLDAAVHPENSASQALFAAEGYRRVSEIDWRSRP